MAVTLVFLGKLADLAGPERAIVCPGSWAGLLAALEPDLAEAVRSANVRLALNGAMVPDKDALALKDGDELAFLPPVSGG